MIFSGCSINTHISLFTARVELMFYHFKWNRNTLSSYNAFTFPRFVFCCFAWFTFAYMRSIIRRRHHCCHHRYC